MTILSDAFQSQQTVVRLWGFCKMSEMLADSQDVVTIRAVTRLIALASKLSSAFGLVSAASRRRVGRRRQVLRLTTLASLVLL